MDTTLLIFAIIVGVSVIGLVVVIVLLKNDKNNEDSIVKLDPDMISRNETLDLGLDALKKDLIEDQPKKKFSLSKLNLSKKEKKEKAPKKQKAIKPKKEKKNKKSSLAEKVFGRLKRKSKNNPEDSIPQATPFPDLQEKMESPFNNPDESSLTHDHVSLLDNPEIGTASLKTDSTEQSQSPIDPASNLPNIPIIDNNDESSDITLSAQEEKQLEQQVEKSTQLDEIMDKYRKVENLLKEKSIELDKVKEELENETKNRKDFNKVKDILEKEIREQKDKLKELQRQSGDSGSALSNKDQQIQKLEDKATMLEKQLAEKEQELTQLKNQTAPSDDSSDKTEEAVNSNESVINSDQKPTEEIILSPIEETTPDTKSTLAEKQPYDPKKIEEELGISVTPKSPKPPAIDINKNKNVETPNLEKSAPENENENSTKNINQSEAQNPPEIDLTKLDKQEKIEKPIETTPLDQTPPIEENDQFPEKSEEDQNEGFLKLQPDIASSENTDKDLKDEEEPPPTAEEDTDDNPEKQNN